jgi:hypothetical protein
MMMQMVGAFASHEHGIGEVQLGEGVVVSMFSVIDRKHSAAGHRRHPDRVCS